MGDTLFKDDALKQFMYWVHNDKKIADKIDDLLKDISRNGANKGIGKPEKLKHKPAWSRRIDEKNRLIYSVQDGVVIVNSCKGHYDED